ncbi:hypothetical protein FF38_08337 [Lucilia cuprina]|uniref:Uncharacterized protein n=1 Tax=Lucilia cuprina TaxID=7375 RepID=A0A0L0BX08_LUCCU|nr:hypothetical protein FF38_08337 [Lucilia cuprina]
MDSDTMQQQNNSKGKRLLASLPPHPFMRTVDFKSTGSSLFTSRPSLTQSHDQVPWGANTLIFNFNLHVYWNFACRHRKLHSRDRPGIFYRQLWRLLEFCLSDYRHRKLHSRYRPGIFFRQLWPIRDDNGKPDIPKSKTLVKSTSKGKGFSKNKGEKKPDNEKGSQVKTLEDFSYTV